MASDGSLRFQHPGTAHGTPAWGFAWSPDGSMWGIGNESGDVRVYRTDGTEVAQTSNPFGNVDVMQWSPDGRILASGSEDRSVRLWRLGDWLAQLLNTGSA